MLCNLREENLIARMCHWVLDTHHFYSGSSHTQKLRDWMWRAATRLGEWEIYDAVPCKDDLATNTNTPNTKYTKYKYKNQQKY